MVYGGVIDLTKDEAIRQFKEIKQNAQNNFGQKWAVGCEAYYANQIELANAALDALYGNETAEWIFGEPDIFGTPVHCSNCGWGVDCVADKETWLMYPGNKYCGCCGFKIDA